MNRSVRNLAALTLGVAGCMFAVAADAVPVTLNVGDTLTIDFRFDAPFTSVPNQIFANVLPTGTNSGVFTYQQSLYDGPTLLGTGIRTTGAGLQPWFSDGVSAPFVPTVDFTTIRNRTINGRISATLTSGSGIFDPQFSVYGVIAARLQLPAGDLFTAGNATISAVTTSVPPPPTIEDIVRGAVRLSPSGNEMDAFFKPNFGYSLEDAARLVGGFDHFNWVQTIVSYPGLLCIPTGYHPRFGDLDPPLGGTFCQAADNLPYYWEEGPGGKPGYYWDGPDQINSITQTAIFSDIPKNVFVTPGHPMIFDTQLVGVYAPGTNVLSYLPLYEFSWMSDYNPCGGLHISPFCEPTGGVSTAQDITPSPGGTGGIFNVFEFPSPGTPPPEVLEAWRLNGLEIQGSVPEPPTILMFLVGLLSLFCLRLRKCVWKAEPNETAT